MDKYIADVEHNESQNKLLLFQSVKETIEIGLIKYLRKYAECLEKVNIFYANCLFYMLASIDIRKFEIASNFAGIIFCAKGICSGGGVRRTTDMGHIYG